MIPIQNLSYTLDGATTAVSTHALPEPAQSPNPSHAPTLVPPPDALAPLAHLAPPLAADPPPEAVLEPLALYGTPLGHERRCHGTPDDLAGQHAALDERLGRGSQREAPRQLDGHETAGQAPRDLRCVRQEDVPRDELGERRARGRDEQGRQRDTDPAEAVVM
jgi:hypothetical protein